MILMVLVLFSLILGNSVVGSLINVAIDNEALVDGSPVTYEVIGQDVLFTIDTSVLIIAGIALLVAVLVVAGITGIQVLGSGISTASAKVIIMLTAFIGIWTALSVLAFNLIIDIEIFGSVIYISLTIGYVIGVIQVISGGGDD